MKRILCLLLLASTLNAAEHVEHRSHKKLWITVAVMVGSGALAGYLASRGTAPNNHIIHWTPVDNTPTISGVTILGLGGPQKPITVTSTAVSIGGIN